MKNTNLGIQPDGNLALVGRALIEAAAKKLNEALVLIDIARIPLAGAHVQEALDALPLHLLNKTQDND